MSADLTVVDVYESAAQIGKDLERLIDAVGSEVVEGLMPKVIRVLEQLELCVRQRESNAGNLQAAREEVRRLTYAQETTSRDNLRIVAEVKELDGQRQEEIRDWMRMAKELQLQNGRLKAQLSEKEGIVVREKAHEQEAMQILYQLKETVDRQRDKLHVKDDELKTRALEVDALQQHVDRLAQVTTDLRRKNEVLSSAATSLIHDKSQLQSELRAVGKDAALAPTKTAAVAGAGGGNGVDIVDGSINNEQERKEKIPGANIVSISMDGKAIIDLSDPDRPRFTLKELQTVLQERDELKLDIIEMEDELNQYRPKDGSSSPETDTKERSYSGGKPKGEPSGIKKLFSFLFRGKNNPKTSTAGEEESSWEFLEKPAKADAQCTPSEPSADPKVRASTLSAIPLPSNGEGKTKEVRQRSRSFNVTGIKASLVELFEPSTSDEELGKEGGTAMDPPAVPAGQLASPSHGQSNGEPLSVTLDRSGEMREPGEETKVGGEGAPKILLNNNEDDDVAVEM